MLLAGSTECPQQNGYIIATTQDYKDTKEFDSFVQSRRNLNVEYIRRFQADYLCPEYNGRGQQFHMSILCAMLTDKSNQCTSEPQNPFIPLCQDTCRQGTNALRNVFGNRCVSIQTPDSLSIRNQTIGQYNAFCDSLPIKNPRVGRCLDGSRQPVELNQCGFPTLGEAQTFCNSVNSVNFCCNTVNRTATESPLPTIQPDCQRNPQLCNNQRIGIQISDGLFYSLIVIGIILFLGIIVLVYRCLGNKAKTNPAENSKKPYLVVISNYEAKMADELNLVVGDKLQMYETYDDGWGFGKHLGNNREGTFPLVCTVLAPLE
jgi:hypothetical protein